MLCHYLLQGWPGQRTCPHRLGDRAVGHERPAVRGLVLAAGRRRARARGPSSASHHPDFLFVQMTEREFAPRGWQPALIDYLYTSFTNATAFSPTDTMPLTPMAKSLMAAQSLHRAGHDRAGRGASRQHSAPDALPPPARNPAPAPPAPPGLGAHHLRGVRTRARRARRRPGPPTGRPRRPGPRRCPLAPLPALRHLGPAADPRASRAPPSPGPGRDRRAGAGQGPARPDRAAPDRDRPGGAFHRAGPARARGAAVRLAPGLVARRLLPDPHGASRAAWPAGRSRPPGTSASCATWTACSPCGRAPCTRSAPPCWATASSRVSRPSGCGWPSDGPSTSPSSPPPSCCRWRSTRSSTRARC